MKKHRPLFTALLTGLLITGGACSENYTPPEGTWACTSEWVKESDGVNVVSSSEQHNTCVKGTLTTTGTISIGEARWSEKKEGTCLASADALYGTWSSVKTVPENEAARLFEQERLGGQSLAKASTTDPSTYRVKVLSRTDTNLKASDPDGKIITCAKL